MGVCGCAGFLRNFEISVGFSGRFSEVFESFCGVLRFSCRLFGSGEIEVEGRNFDDFAKIKHKKY